MEYSEHQSNNIGVDWLWILEIEKNGIDFRPLHIYATRMYLYGINKQFHFRLIFASIIFSFILRHVLRHQIYISFRNIIIVLQYSFHVHFAFIH